VVYKNQFMSLTPVLRKLERDISYVIMKSMKIQSWSYIFTIMVSNERPSAEAGDWGRFDI